MKRFLILSVVPLVLFAFSAYAFKHHGKGHDTWLWWKDTSIVEQLNLNDEQKSNIEEISSSYKAKYDEMRPGVDEKRKAFMDALGNPDSTKEEIVKAYDDMWNAKSQMKRTKLEMKLDIREVLNRDQITKLTEIKQQRKEERMKKYEKKKEY